MKKTRQLTFCAIMSALGIVVLYLGALINILDLCAVLIASVFVFVVSEGLGNLKGLAVYAVTSLLAVLLLFSMNIFIMAEYVLFGMYPMLKRIFDKFKTPLMLVCKGAYMAAVSIGTLLVERFWLGNLRIWYLEALIVVITFAALILYDIAFKRVAVMYHARLRHKLRIDKFFS